MHEICTKHENLIVEKKGLPNGSPYVNWLLGLSLSQRQKINSPLLYQLSYQGIARDYIYLCILSQSILCYLVLKTAEFSGLLDIALQCLAELRTGQQGGIIDEPLEVISDSLVLNRF